MNWKPPKEFGDRSPGGLADLRALDQLDVPFARALGVDHVSFKANGFNRVERKPAPRSELPGTWLTEGRRIGHGDVSRIALTPAPGIPATDFPASAIGGSAGSITYIGHNKVLAAGFTGTGDNVTGYDFQVASTSDFKTKTVELNYKLFGPALDLTFVESNTPRIQAPGADYVVLSVHYYTAGNDFAPLMLRRVDGTWTQSSAQYYAGYDHISNSGMHVLSPTVMIACYGVFARETYFSVGGRPPSPAGVSTPYPLLELSVDAGVSFQAYDMAPMFTGMTTAWNPYIGVPNLGESIGGRDPMNTFVATAIGSKVLMGFRGPADTGTEYRMFLCPNASGSVDIPASSIQVTTPPGFNTTWRSIVSMTANARINTFIAQTGVSTLLGTSLPRRLFLTIDDGATWIDRPLPWPGLYTGQVFALSPRQLAVIVYDPIRYSTVLYLSENLGLKWTEAGFVGKNVNPPNDSEGFQDFATLTQIGVGADGLEPVPDPMAPYRHNYRYKR